MSALNHFGLDWRREPFAGQLRVGAIIAGDILSAEYSVSSRDLCTAGGVNEIRGDLESIALESVPPAHYEPELTGGEELDFHGFSILPAEFPDDMSMHLIGSFEPSVAKPCARVENHSARLARTDDVPGMLLLSVVDRRPGQILNCAVRAAAAYGGHSA